MSHVLAHRLLSVLLLMALTVQTAPAAAAPTPSRDVAPAQAAAEASIPDPTSAPAAGPTASGCFWADFNCDHFVDVFDIVTIADRWDCATDDACYSPVYDIDGDAWVRISDILKVIAEFDPDPPYLVVDTPTEGQTLGGEAVHVSGSASDRHGLTVTVNGQAASLVDDQFAVDLALETGNHVINVAAEDELGAVTLETRLVHLDGEGPQVAVVAPKDRQAAYTATPTVEIGYEDFYAQVDTGTLSVVLQTAGSDPLDVTGDLVVEPQRAYGVVGAPLQEDASYTMTVTLQDTFANQTVLATTFYVPHDPASITPPAEPEQAGWVSGRIFDSATCDQHLTTCQGLAGATVTLERVDTAVLAQVRAVRKQRIEQEWLVQGMVTHRPLAEKLSFTQAVSGTVVSGPDGFFAFPAAETGRYWLRVEKAGYTYGQREAEIVRRRSTASNEIYLTPIDPAVTTCDEGGCDHASSDGMVEVAIPPGAIPPGEVVTTTATNFEQVEFLPSGALPPGTQETYAFNLGGDSEYQFDEPVGVRIQNYRGFAPGTEIPLGYWNQGTQAWEHAGVGVIDASGQWVEMQVTHFSNWDCNDPPSVGSSGGSGSGNSGSGGGDCGGGGEECPPEGGACQAGCSISLKFGTVEEQIDLPTVDILGRSTGPRLLYNTNRANPGEVIDITVDLNPDQGIEFGGTIGFELYIEGQKTDEFTFAATVQPGEAGRFRYYWDARDAQGDRLPPGVYEYAAKFSIPYRAQYCGPIGMIFGNPPDCENLPTGVFVDATDEVWVDGTVELNPQVDSPLGAGWVLAGQQQLYEDEAGRILVADGDALTEYYAAGKDLLLQDERERVREWEGESRGAGEGLVEAVMPPAPDEDEPLSASPQDEGQTPESIIRAYSNSVAMRREHALVRPQPNPPAPFPGREGGGRLPHLAGEGWEGPPTGFEHTGSIVLPLVLTSPPSGGEETPVEPPPTPPVAEIAVRASDFSVASDVSGPIITDTTWTLAGSPYVVTGDVTVVDGVTLTVEAGVTVIFNQYLNLTVHGNLLAVGAASQPITFTAAVSNTVGYWGYVQIGGGDDLGDSDASRLSYVTIEGGSYYPFLGSLFFASSAPALDHLTIRNSGGHGIYADFAGPFTLDTALIEDNGNDGIFIYYGDGGQSLTNLTVQDNDGDGIDITAGAGGQSLTNLVVQDNGGHGLTVNHGGSLLVAAATLANNSGYGIYVPDADNDLTLRNSIITGNGVAARLPASALLEDNDWSGNARNEIEWSGGVIDEDRTWSRGVDAYRIVNNVAAADGVTLTVEAGVTVIFNQYTDLAVHGNLLAVGAASQPITFTAAVSNTVGYWGYVQIGGGSDLGDSDASRLSYVTIEGGSYYPFLGSLFFASSAPALDHLTIRNSGGHGIYADFAGPFTLDTALIEDNGNDGIFIYYGDGGQVLSSLVVQGNGYDGIDIDGSSGQALSDLTVQGNGGDGLRVNHGGSLLVAAATLANNSGYGIYVPDADNDLTLRNSIITGNGVAARLPANARLENNLWLSNQLNQIQWQGGAITGDSEWQVESIDSYRVLGDITVADGVTLTVAAGAEVGFDPSTNLWVDGALAAVGTAADPIVFRRAIEGSRWGYVRIGGGNDPGDSDHSRLSFVTIEGGSDRSLYIYRSTPTLDHLAIRNSAGHGLYVYDSDGLAVTVSNFTGNADHGLYNATPAQVVTATYNYWGAPSGPYHPTLNPDGLGQPVSDGVLFQPWLLEETLDLGVASLTETDYTRMVYDPDSNTYTRIYPDETRVHFNRDGSHDHTLWSDGWQTVYTYNADGSVASMGVIPPGEETPRWTWTFDYSDGKLSSITDPAGRVSTFTVDGHGHLVEAAFPDGSARGFTYDDRHLMTQQTDQAGDVTTYAYDDYGRIRQAIYPPRPVYDPDSGQTEVRQEVKTFTPSDTAYPLINESVVGDPDQPAPAVPHSEDLADGVAYGRGSRTGHTNQWGYWQDKADGLGRTTTYQRDERNQITRKTLPDGDCIEYAYDDSGNMLSEARMGAAQCALLPHERDPAQVQTRRYTYEEQFNQVKTETDPLGHITTYTYDYEESLGQAGNLIQIEYPPVEDEHGQVVTPTVQYTYNAWELRETETDARGTVTRYVYTLGTADEAYGQPGALFAEGVTPVPGLLTQVIEDYGDASHLNVTSTYRDFDGAGQPLTVLGPGGGAGCCSGAAANGTVTRYTYDAWGRTLSEENALGIVTQYEYDGRGNRVRQVQDYTPDGVTGRNVVSEYRYDADDQLLVERTAADGIVQEQINAYDVNGQLAAQTDGNGHATIYRYDAADQLVAVTDPLGHTTTYSYTLQGQQARVTDTDGYVTHFVYDDLGRMASVIRDEEGLYLAASITYDLNNNLRTITDPAGTVTCYEYDSHNRLTAVIMDCSALDLTATYAYDRSGNQVYETDQRGTVTAYGYDALDRLNLMRQDDGGLNLETSLAYDAAGNLYRTTDERGVVTELTYDDLNRLEQSCQDALGLNLCTTYTYDRLNNRLSETDAQGVTTRREHNAFGLPTRQVADYGVGGLNATTRYDYDDNLNLVGITDANGNSTRYSYTPRNEIAGEHYADGATVSYTYDGRGNLAQRTDQEGETTTLTYDGAGRLLHTAFSSGGWQSFTYDEASRLTGAEQSMSGHHSLLTFAYNALGDVTGTTQTLDGAGWQVDYGYDYVAGIITISYPSGVQRVRELDPLYRLDAVRDGSGDPIASYAYHDLESYFALAHANGVTERTDYDALYRTTRVSSAVADYRYGYDDAGNRTYRQRWHEPEHPADVYEYDGLHQFVQVWYGADATEPDAITAYDRLQWYDLDTVGNRLAVQNDDVSEIYLPNDGQRLTNPMNRYEQVGAAIFSYDLRGNTLADGANSYEYDILNRQVGMNGPGGVAEYIYDALGRRVAKMVDGAATYFVYNTSYQVIEERDGGDQLAARYTHGDYIDEPLTMERGGDTYHYHQDAPGSVSEVSDAGGSLAERYEYDVYGQPRIFDDAGSPLPATAIGNPYLFTGRRYDRESGNYYYRIRAYAPRVGRFIQMDPFSSPALNAYLYCQDNPVSCVDPYGLRDQKPSSSNKPIIPGVNDPVIAKLEKVVIWWMIAYPFIAVAYGISHLFGHDPGPMPPYFSPFTPPPESKTCPN